MANSTNDLDGETFMRLFVTHERAILRFVLCFVPALADARDVVQETAVTLWQKRLEYDGAREFLPWACGIARWKIREFWRKQKRWDGFADGDLLERIEARREELSEELAARHERLQFCVDKLPAFQRQLIFGYYVTGDTVEKLSGTLGKSVEAIYKLLQRIRRSLMECASRTSHGESAS